MTTKMSYKNVEVEKKEGRFLISLAAKTFSLCKNEMKKLFYLIMVVISTLSNSGGGDIDIELIDKKEIDKFIEHVGQKIEIFFGAIFLSENVKIICDEAKVTFKVEPAGHLLTLEYNFFLPGNSGVSKLKEHNFSIKMFTKIMENGSQAVAIKRIGVHIFTKYEQMELSQAKTEQFKLLVDNQSKNVRQADRMTNGNNFKKYVSAFANHAGGYIYYGINDEGIVIGQRINEKSKARIEAKMTKQIEECIWLEKDEPIRGTDWDVKFVPVQDPENPSQQIPEMFVVVVYVAKSRGVFTDIPECYHIVETYHNLKIQPMDFETWREAFSPNSTGLQRSSQKKYDHIHKYLQILLDNGLWEDLEEEISSDFRSSPDVELFVICKTIHAFSRRGWFDEAMQELDALQEKRHQISGDFSILEVYMVYLRLIIERGRENYDVCYRICQENREKVKKIPVSFMTAAYLAVTGTIAAILAGKETDLKSRKSLVKEAEEYLMEAFIHAEKYAPTNHERFFWADTQQKVYVNLILLKLGFTLCGDLLNNVITEEELDEAKTNYDQLKKLLLDGATISKFREIQINMMDACLCYRTSQINIDREFELINEALGYASHAVSLSEECHFEEIGKFSTNIKTFLLGKIPMNTNPSTRVATEN